MRKLTLATLMLFGSVFANCRRTVTLEYPRPAVTAMTYSYREIAPGVFLLWTRDTAALASAKQELGCGVCTVEPVTGVYRVTVVVAKKDR